MEPTDRDWIGVIGLRLVETLENCPEIDPDTAELIAASTQLGIINNPGLLRQWREGNSIIESDYFENDNQARNSSRRYKITRLR
jgi:hypothetical protein